VPRLARGLGVETVRPRVAGEGMPGARVNVRLEGDGRVPQRLFGGVDLLGRDGRILSARVEQHRGGNRAGPVKHGVRPGRDPRTVKHNGGAQPVECGGRGEGGPPAEAEAHDSGAALPATLQDGAHVGDDLLDPDIRDQRHGLGVLVVAEHSDTAPVEQVRRERSVAFGRHAPGDAPDVLVDTERLLQH
jgi:hypothetical protein